jgi:hypothetical protein
MIGPKIFSTVLSLSLMLMFFYSGGSSESKMRSVSHMDPASVTPGIWGGPHLSVEVTDKGARLNYDCAHGTIDHRLKTDRRGHFEASGLHYKERGGPVRRDDNQSGAPATYTGTINGQTMTLTVTLTNTHEIIGTFTLTHGKRGRVTKCL